ncbi:MAG TPA: PEP/pyruvate-binding domain-containing protein, partial [Nitrospirota bacterium]|nr:PEP/pyruvate-binding domain-containing protein [Nitrospirota bacterium]
MKHPLDLKSIVSSLSRTFSRRKFPSDPAEFRAVFERFKSVLESNNRALETITDMGEKLGGDYLFDIVYVKKAYASLKNDMETSLHAFDELTQGRHERLRESFAHLDSLISSMVNETLPAAGAPVLFFEEIPWGVSQVVGGKNANLAEVKNQLHLPVPDAFVITAAGFDAFVRQNRLDSHIEQLKQESSLSDSFLQELQELILHGEVPPEVSRRIQKALDKIRRRNNGAYLALRSSALDEDSGHSFAGQFKTVLNVPPELQEVERAYRKVLASLYSGKAVAYQQQLGYDISALKMAVGCMVMVDAAASGVIYSITPEGDRDRLIISAAWGLGEAIVEGKTETDLYLVRKGSEPELVRATYGNKQSMIVTGARGGTAEVQTPDELKARPCLTPEQIMT